MQNGKLNILLDLGYGSSGKGNIAAFLGDRHKVDVTISNGGPNAGHSIIYDGEVKVVKMVPTSGIYNKNALVMIGSGTVIDVGVLLKEIKEFELHNRIMISPTAPIVSDYCREYERLHLQYIASTFQGTGAAIGLKAMRSKDIKLAKDCAELKNYICDNMSDVLLTKLKSGATALCEISQGYGLSVDCEHYPFCTSRPVNVGQSLAYLDVPASIVGDVIGVTRTYPIRVGNVPDGYSGDVAVDSKEISWEQLSEKIGRPVKELTSVTKRVRRIFTFSKQLFERAVRRNGVNILFLSFVDYLLPDELDNMISYTTSSKFNFKEIYFVRGFWEFDKNIERIR